MYRIVIADDEQFIVQLVRQLIDYQQLNVEVIGEASDGNTALELLTTLKPDILITDIRMPYMDGLQLIEKIREHKLPISVIAISGHRRFDYAYNALKYDVHDFIVKPIGRKELNDAIAKVVHYLNRKSQDDHHIEHIRQQMNISAVQLHRKLLEDCLQGSLNGNTLAQINQNYAASFLPGQYTGIAVRLDMSQEITSESLIVRKCREVLDNFLHDCADEYMFHFIDKEALFSILVNTRPEQTSQLTRNIKRMFELLGVTMDVYSHVNITIGVGSTVENIVGIPGTLRMAIMNSRINCVLGAQRIYSSSEFAIEKNRNQHISTVQTKELTQILEFGRINDVSSWLYSVFSCSEEYYRKHPLEALSLGDSILDTFQTLCRIRGINIDEDILSHEYAFINRCGTLQDYLQHIICFMQKVLEEDYQLRVQRNNYPVECTKNYVAEHLGESFKLEDIAKHTMLAPNYLSTLFKKETGETISDYTQKLRLEKAKNLLRTTNLNLNEIAAQVGYSDPKHFSKLFKKTFGIRPQDYRKMYSW